MALEQELPPLSEEAHDTIDEAMYWLVRDNCCQCQRCLFIRRLCLALQEATGADLPNVH